MTERTLYVVGNRFEEIADGDAIVSFDDALERCRSDRIDASRISLQQGVSERQHRTLQAALAGNEHVRLVSYFDEYRRCSGELTHKAKPENTLISDPQTSADDNSYTGILMIDDACAELSDHVTGKHVQFMVLIEAARQMGNAVTQKFHSTAAKIYLAEEIRVGFATFVYPFETRIDCRVTRRDLRATGDGKMALEIGFVQQGKIACQLSLAFTVLDRKFVTSLEMNALKAFVR
ncbi:AfsA-related hotdog domain-containing protein [Burkholderia ambifaria]|uniref:AfsA-related hotdog domain-containing protein n=1 Tax=Burkholderia ambifaria TaxID=152480 RepID=UPI00158E8AF6|nr:AfsA-related hotdog domain-containing protein [Burkholderia ambifaria]